MSRAVLLAVLMAVLATPPPTYGQGLPPYAAVNPMLTSRSGLFAQPYVDPEKRWQVRLLLDYASSVEVDDELPARLVVDGEFLRLDATVLRNIGPAFVGASLGLRGAYDGFLDGFLDWYHDVTGLRVPARDVRPRNLFGYRLEAPGVTLLSESSSGFVGDLRLMAGHRHTRHWQSTLTVTLPTATGPAGYGRGTASVSGITTVRAPVNERLTFEATAGIGYTPRHGPLSDLQREVFRSASGGARYRFWGRQALFFNVFYQSANYAGTTLKSLDRRELTIDYGFLFRSAKGPEWFLGMTEDLEPAGPAIDLSFRIGARW